MRTRPNTASSSLLALLLALSASALTACEDGNLEPQDPGPEEPIDEPIEPGTPIDPPAEDPQARAIVDALEQIAGLDAEGLLERYALDHVAELGFDPLEAAHLDLIQDSPLGLDDAERQMLGERGFVISDRRTFPTHGYGYASIYMSDLPVYISADSMLYAVHRSYDDILMALEISALAPDLDTMLEGMRARLVDGAADGLPLQARADVDLYLTVALSLLRGERLQPVAGGDGAAVAALLDGVEAAQGRYRVELFGASRDVDFSQFTVRGHYLAPEDGGFHEILPRYFKAMIWLGRIDFRLIETQPDHSRVFHRRQLEGVLALAATMSPDLEAAYGRIDRAIGAFIGEHDYMVLDEVKRLMGDLGADGPDAYPATLAANDDADIAAAIDAGGYGAQRISSHIMVNGTGSGTLPLSRSFALLGQRYVVDSHVFSNVVFDRAQTLEPRMMPDPLDVAFAALKNDQAAALLADELRRYDHAEDLAAMRVLVDHHDETYWQSSLYTLWLDALRALSPGAEVADPAAAGMPAVTGTEAWGRRILSAQLASWAELRHDTILYAKQSYTAAAGCEYPDAYVDPYPAFYGKLEAFAGRGQQLVDELAFSDAGLRDQIAAWFDNLADVSRTLREMAELQRQGLPFDEGHLAFVNDAVTLLEGGCVPTGLSGWYGRLFFDNEGAIEFSPTIADVHTQPTEADGSPAGKVLHAGTGFARMMVVAVETCEGPRAYVGVASSYYETVTRDYERLTDPQWQGMVRGEADVPWMQDLVVR